MLTPFGAVYRYVDYDGAEPLNRAETLTMLARGSKIVCAAASFWKPTPKKPSK